MTPSKRRGGYTIRDIATMAGVSRSTVSLAINNSPKINSETKQRVMALIDEVGYRPNQAARNLVHRTSKTILIILPPIDHIFSDSYFSESLSGILDVATRRQYHLMVESATDLFKRENRALGLFRQHTIDGVLVVGNLNSDTYLLDLAAARCPVVLVNSHLDGIASVVGGNFQASVRAVKHLHQLGHRRIGHIRGSTDIWSACERTNGFLQAVKELDLEFEDGLITQGYFGQRSGRDAMKQLLARDRRPTAVFCANDMMAIGAMQAIKEADLSIPDDIALVGADDIQLGRYVTPQLTTIQQSMYSLGEGACEHLFSYLDNKKVYTPKLEIGLRLVIRQSCGASANAHVPPQPVEK